jgi:hypothetical protein
MADTKKAASRWTLATKITSTATPVRETDVAGLREAVRMIRRVPGWKRIYEGVSESRGHCQCRLSFIDQTADGTSVEITYVAAFRGAGAGEAER